MSTNGSTSLVKQQLDQKCERACEQLRELMASLPATLDDLGDAEQRLREGLLVIGGGLLQSWSEAVDAQATTPECESCQEAMRHKGYVVGPLTTTLGTVRVRRPRFRCEHCGAECYPHDERLRFRAHAVSWPLAKLLGRLGAQLPFEQARQSVLADYRVRVSKALLQTVCEEAGVALLEEEDAERERVRSLPPAEQWKELPDSEIVPEKAYVFGDGAMIHTAGDWHEIRVASVAAEDAEGEILDRQHRARFLSCEDFGWQLLMLARRSGYHRARLRAFIADGARWLWDVAELQFPDAVQILDWFHLSERVHGAAAAIFGPGTPEASQFSKARLDELWNGRSSQTLSELRSLRKQLRAADKRESLRTLITYLDNNRHRIDYPRYRTLGLKVGSGQVEGACKSLVGARCKQSGMRNWTHRGAEGVLRLRAALQTGDYDTLWTPPIHAAA
jgi:hypothetical protein